MMISDSDRRELQNLETHLKRIRDLAGSRENISKIISWGIDVSFLAEFNFVSITEGACAAEVIMWMPY